MPWSTMAELFSLVVLCGEWELLWIMDVRTLNTEGIEEHRVKLDYGGLTGGRPDLVDDYDHHEDQVDAE